MARRRYFAECSIALECNIALGCNNGADVTSPIWAGHRTQLETVVDGCHEIHYDVNNILPASRQFSEARSSTMSTTSKATVVDMSYLQPIFDGELEPGVYQLVSRAKSESLFRDMEENGWRGFFIDGDKVTDKASFLEATAAAMNFPGYFGHNWDAFEESLNDLTWAPAKGYVLLYDNLANFADQSPEDWAVARSIFENAIDSWQAEGVPFFMLLRGTRSHGRSLVNF